MGAEATSGHKSPVLDALAFSSVLDRFCKKKTSGHRRIRGFGSNLRVSERRNILLCHPWFSLLLDFWNACGPGLIFICLRNT